MRRFKKVICAGLLDWNCRHNFNPYVDGAPQAYMDEVLEQYSAKTIRYNGKMYTEYEVTQMQRYHERQSAREQTVIMGGLRQGEQL